MAWVKIKKSSEGEPSSYQPRESYSTGTGESEPETGCWRDMDKAPNLYKMTSAQEKVQ